MRPIEKLDRLSARVSDFYAASLLIVGIGHFISAKSRLSLIVGIIGSVLVYTFNKFGLKYPKVAYDFITAFSLILAFYFSIRFAYNSIFFPNGFMLIISAITFLVVGYNWFKQFPGDE